MVALFSRLAHTIPLFAEITFALDADRSVCPACAHNILATRAFSGRGPSKYPEYVTECCVGNIHLKPPCRLRSTSCCTSFRILRSEAFTSDINICEKLDVAPAYEYFDSSATGGFLGFGFFLGFALGLRAVKPTIDSVSAMSFDLIVLSIPFGHESDGDRFT